VLCTAPEVKKGKLSVAKREHEILRQVDMNYMKHTPKQSGAQKDLNYLNKP
jgi:hypothetical protein